MGPDFIWKDILKQKLNLVIKSGLIPKVLVVYKAKHTISELKERILHLTNQLTFLRSIRV